LRETVSISELIRELLEVTSYLVYLQEDPETMEDRKENIDELLGKAAEWEAEHENPTLSQFLEDLSLHIPRHDDPTEKTVKMMTLHNSKGLEFPIVFLVGMEEDLLPHINSKDDSTAMEEERRLCYVGMTRAKQKLYLCHAKIRYMWGAEKLMKPSRFLEEVAEEYTYKVVS
jgi:DNA helicase-2/ATP-dependent DNA helicase PcrA